MRRLLAPLLPLLLLATLAACTPGQPFAAFQPRTDLVRLADTAAGRLSAQLQEEGRAAATIRLGRLEPVAGGSETPLSEMLMEQVAAGLVRRGHVIDRSLAPSLPELLFQGPQRPRELTLRGVAPTLDLGGTYAAGRDRVFVSLRVADSAEQRLLAADDFDLRQDADVRALLVNPDPAGYRRDLAGNYYLPR